MRIAAATVLTALLFYQAGPDVRSALPAWAFLIVWGCIALGLQRIGGGHHHAVAGRSTGSGNAVGCHEVAHGLAVKRGKGKLHRMDVSNNTGVTHYDLGAMDERSVQHLTVIAAGIEAQARCLVKDSGYSWSQARRESRALNPADIHLMHTLGDAKTIAAAERAARSLVRQNYGKISRAGTKLTNRGTLHNI